MKNTNRFGSILALAILMVTATISYGQEGVTWSQHTIRVKVIPERPPTYAITGGWYVECKMEAEGVDSDGKRWFPYRNDYGISSGKTNQAGIIEFYFSCTVEFSRFKATIKAYTAPFVVGGENHIYVGASDCGRPFTWNTVIKVE